MTSRQGWIAILLLGLILIVLAWPAINSLLPTRFCEVTNITTNEQHCEWRWQ